MRLRRLLRLRGRASTARSPGSASKARSWDCVLLNASGCLDALTAPEVARSLDAFVTKTVTPEPRDGNPPVRIAEAEGRDAERDRTREPGPREVPGADAAALRELGVPIWVSVGGFSAATTPRPARSSTAPRRGIELNLSCPNVDEAPESAAEIVAACRAATGLPLFAKLSPAAWDIGEVARAVEAAGADGLSLVNTIRGLALDRRLQPRLARGNGRVLGACAEADRARRRLPLPARDGAADRRHGRCRLGSGRARAGGLRRDPRRARDVLFADPEAPGGCAPSSPTSSRQPVSTGSRAPIAAAHDSVAAWKLARTMPLARCSEGVSMRR